jgi:DNA-binding transcriptional LysR family regulator
MSAPGLEDLRTFCVAAELGTLGRAAARLHITQPAVSKRLQHLEAHCGVRLLDRSGRGVTLTAPGERLYAHARRILAEMTDLAATIEQLRGSADTVTLAISPTAADALLSAALMRMQSERNAPVEVVIANSRTVKRMVAAGEVDVGVAAFTVGESTEDAALVPLFDDEIVIAVPLSHAWARARRVSPRELAATPIIRRDPGAQTREVVDAAMHAAGHPNLIAAVEVGTTQAAKQEAHRRGLPAVMSWLAITPADNLEVVRVDGVAFRRRFCVLPGSRTPGMTASADRLVEALSASAGATARPAHAAAASSRSPSS